MLFSIITVTYNSAATLQDTFDSVLAQTYKNYEYIVIDGKSQDTTLDIIKGYEPNFEGKMHWISEVDNGLYDAMNKGLSMAKGDVIVIINSDDIIFDNEALQHINNIFLEIPNTDAVYADLYYVNPQNTNEIVRVWKCGEQKSFTKAWIPAHPTFYAKRDVYLKYGYFDTTYKLAADFDLMLRFIEKEKIKLTYLPKFLVKMRLGGQSNKSLKNIYIQNCECIKAFKKYSIDYNPISFVFSKITNKLRQFK